MFLQHRQRIFEYVDNTKYGFLCIMLSPNDKPWKFVDKFFQEAIHVECDFKRVIPILPGEFGKEFRE